MSKNVFDIFNFKKNNVPTADIEQVIDSALFESSSTVHTGTEKQSNKHLKHNKLIISDLGTLDTVRILHIQTLTICHSNLNTYKHTNFYL